MIVSFDPAVGGNVSDYNALYVNFLRCVTAIATASAGTSSLSVPAYASASSTNGTNCITAILANSEAGGWTTSSSQNIPSYPTSFTSMTSSTSYSNIYKADFYNLSGKSTYPYNKFTIHCVGHNTTGYDAHYSGYISSAPLTNFTNGYAQIQQTFGCSTTSAGDSNYTPSYSTTTPNQQSTSWTNNAYFSMVTPSNLQYSPGTAVGCANNAGFNLSNYGSVTYTMAVTANYCIIWENHRSNSYSAGYANTYSPASSNVSLYGTLMYGGLRTTQAWEDALGYNPPWCAFTVHHCTPGGQNYQTNVNSNYFIYNYYTNESQTWYAYGGQPPNCAAAFMATSDNTGVVSSSATAYKNYPHYQYFANPLFNMCAVSGSGYSTAAGTMDYCFGTSFSYQGQYSGTAAPLVTPLFHQRQRRSNNANGTVGTTHNPNLPTIDPVTGTYVPGAYPITFAKTTSGAWNAGGTAKGIYKSLTMPLSNMKLYWSSGQTFNIGSDTYLPIVFNEDMYLIRSA